MKSLKYIVAATELLLVFPALLFMTALFVRNLQPQEFEPAHTAQRIVMWYSERPHVGLWLLLIALPFAVLVSGCAVLWLRWRSDAELRQFTSQTCASFRNHLATLFVAATTLAAGAVLAIVALHVITD
jgi:hypothetical protein